jgi:hypothetical protein
LIYQEKLTNSAPDHGLFYDFNFGKWYNLRFFLCDFCDICDS